MKRSFKAAVALAAAALASQAMASITLYEGEGFRGRAATTAGAVPDMRVVRFDDRAGSAIVDKGRWEVCEHPNFQGRCALLRRGNYDSLRGTGLEWRISSVRPAGARHHDLQPRASVAPLYEYRRRPSERVYEVPVSWSRAVVGPPSQRCWTERHAVPAPGNGNLGGALAGAVIGGVLGHQIGNGSGRDAATGVGAVAGAAIGANVGGGGNGVVTQDVQRCTTTPSAAPAYYEVAYNFRGVEHRIQMTSPPAGTIVVNERGEPRM